VAQELRQGGWVGARALTGGWDAWQAMGLPVEPKASESDAETVL
jgi:3-mercaptopyruvate sulfurtransferase SseA